MDGKKETLIRALENSNTLKNFEILYDMDKNKHLQYLNESTQTEC